MKLRSIMQNKSIYKLSICIPTYNRAKQFDRLMSMLAPQIEKGVELVIRDDSTNTETEQVLKKYFPDKKLNFINYIKGEKIGLDAANLFLLESAQGDHVWFFSDDDGIRADAVKYILNLLNTHEIDYAWINFKYGENKTAIPVGNDRYFVDNNEVLSITGRSIGFLTTTLIKKSEAVKFLSLAKKNIYGFAFAIVITIMGVLRTNSKLFLITQPLIINNPTLHDEIKEKTNKNGIITNDGFYVYGIYLKMVIKMFSNNFQKSAVRNFIKKNYRQTWMGMVVGYCGQWDTPRGKRIQMLKHYWMFPETIIAILLLSVPRYFLNGIYQIYKKVYRSNNRD